MSTRTTLTWKENHARAALQEFHSASSAVPVSRRRRTAFTWKWNHACTIQFHATAKKKKKKHKMKSGPHNVSDDPAWTKLTHQNLSRNLTHRGPGHQTPHEHGVTTLAKGWRRATLGKNAWLIGNTGKAHQEDHPTEGDRPPAPP